MSPFLIVLLSIGGFAIYWIALFWLIALMTGWSKLASSYAAYHHPEGERYGWRTLQLSRFSHYGNSINTTLSSEGIYLVPVAAFRMGHQPILFPWSLVTKVESSGFPRTGIQVTIEPEGRRWQLYLPKEARPTVERYTRRGMVPPTNPILTDDRPNLYMGRKP